MNDLNFGSRLWLAFTLPWKILFDGSWAARVADIETTPALPGQVEGTGKVETPSPAATKAEEAELKEMEPSLTAVEPETDLTAALQLLSILQREGRFIDFIQEDMSGFADAEIGAAARVVQAGCKRGLSEYVKLAAIRSEDEGATIRLEAGYDAKQTRVTGNVAGEPPYMGTLAHHGWRAESIVLPQLSQGHDPSVLAPAEVEI